MGRDQRKYEDDDGRTIADMSEVEGPSLFIPRFPGKNKAEHSDPKGSPTQPGLSRGEQWMFVLGALKAALLVALPFILGFALLILLLIWFGT